MVELFAGVGGFRVGLERASKVYRVVWSNQWEPATRKQDASDIYVARFGAKGHCNADIATVDAAAIPDHDLLVGGFPCQDYSVARSLNGAAGLQGRKGVLWWDIHRILRDKRHKPDHLLLENVDRLLKSPAGQRGRDFAVMLASLADLGYAVEWRVINAADHGMPQRRRRVFFLGHHRSTPIGRRLLAGRGLEDWVLHDGILAEAFPVQAAERAFRSFALQGDLAELTESFNAGPSTARSPFADAGVMAGRRVWTIRTAPDHRGPRTTLGDVLLPDDQVPRSFYLAPRDLPRWEFAKGAKKVERTSRSTGHTYRYAEGGMAFPDALDKPSRTIITAEGGASASRFKHVVRTGTGELRRLTPVELERLNMFPDGHTAGVPDTRRAFLMGNALVVGIIERAAAVLAARRSKARRR
ncbi:MAG: hypothetical protein GFGODING_02356 [Flavobacteriales bacterium]|nr:hypothetical protein [Flavobacteriales bacterium]